MEEDEEDEELKTMMASLSTGVSEAMTKATKEAMKEWYSEENAVRVANYIINISDKLLKNGFSRQDVVTLLVSNSIARDRIMKQIDVKKKA